MDLGTFLQDEATGSWADEMDSLPSGPSGDPSFQPGGLGGSHILRNHQQNDRGGFGDRGGSSDRFSDRPPRAEVPIPTAPPYTAYVGNLSYDTNDAIIADFFTGLSIVNIRLVSDFNGKPKGFGYVEFSTVDDLKNALTATGTEFGGRNIRISVAEGKTEGRADSESTWTRSGPLAPLSGRGGPGRDRDRGFGLGGPGEDRDAPLRGGKFVASAPTSERRGYSFGGDRRGGEEEEREGPIRGGKFTPAPVREPRVEAEREGPIRGGKFQPSAPAERKPRPAEEERTWTRTGPLPPLEKSEPRGWGNRAKSNPATNPTSTKPSPFGSGKPTDEARSRSEGAWRKV